MITTIIIVTIAAAAFFFYRKGHVAQVEALEQELKLKAEQIEKLIQAKYEAYQEGRKVAANANVVVPNSPILASPIFHTVTGTATSSGDHSGKAF